MIYTHSGVFHADDAMSVAIALELGKYGQEIRRVRELPEEFNVDSTDIAVDVGSKLNIFDRIFDHHYKGGNDDGRAAVGKMWFQYGPWLCSSRERSDEIQKTLIGSIDRADIGIKDWEPKDNDLHRHLSLSGFISGLNPPFGSDEIEVSKAFNIAVSICHEIIRQEIYNVTFPVKIKEISEIQMLDPIILERIKLTTLTSIQYAIKGIKDWIDIDPYVHVGCERVLRTEAGVKALEPLIQRSAEQANIYIGMKNIVLNAELFADGKAMILEKGGPWQEHIFEMELDDLLYVIFPSDRGGFQIQAVPDKLGSFGMRKALPKKWAGLRDDDLENVLGFGEPTQALFCHVGRFIGGAETIETAKKMTKIAVQED